MSKKNKNSKKTKSSDGFTNINKSLGTQKDPRTNTFYLRNPRITQIEANNIYTTNWLASNIIDIPADESIKNWRELNIENPKKLEEFEQFEKKLDVKGSFAQARKWANIFGGAVIIIIVNDGKELSEKLDIKTLQKDSLKRLIILDRWRIVANNVNADLLSDDFGEPETYTHNESGQEIHHTRILKFNGDSTTLTELEQNNYWGLSQFDRLMSPIQDSMTSSDLISGLLYESNVDIYKIKGLNEAVANGEDEIVVKRIKLANELKSTINAVALDSEDNFEKKFATFTGLAEIDDKYLQKVAGASKIPVTKLLGTSPKGLNATGEGDLLNYYDDVSAMQERVYSPKLNYLDTIMSKSLWGTEEIITFEFKPLFQLSEKEQADLELTRANRDNIYLSNGVIDDDIVLNELNSNKTYGNLDNYIELTEEVE